EGDEPAFHVTLTFESRGKKTHVRMHSLFPTPEALAAVMQYGVVEGGRQTLARLAGHLNFIDSADGAMVLSRLYDASPAKVFAAWTTKAALEKWWGPKGMTTEVPELEFKVGGKYRMVMKDPRDGAQYPFHGTFEEIVANERIVFSAIIDAE